MSSKLSLLYIVEKLALFALSCRHLSYVRYLKPTCELEQFHSEHRFNETLSDEESIRLKRPKFLPFFLGTTYNDSITESLFLSFLNRK